MYETLTVAELLGKTLTAVEMNPDKTQIIFTSEDGARYSMHHDQDCCESVSVEDIAGDLLDLVGSPIVRAEESSTAERPAGIPAPEDEDNSFTYTFYRIATAKGLVVIRWYGYSNGYYSESVSFEMLA